MSHDHHNDGTSPGKGVSRRGFITSVGSGAIGVAAVAGLASAKPATAAPAEAAPPEAVPVGEMTPVTLTVNGRVQKLLVEPRWSLLFVLRDRLGLTGSKVGCERGECGACTVLIDGKARYACMTLAVEADGQTITTVEGLMNGEELGPVQRAVPVAQQRQYPRRQQQTPEC